jgi:excisionase family DNA binding protein
MREYRQRRAAKPAQSHVDCNRLLAGALRLLIMTRSTHTSRLGLTTSEAARHLGVSLSTVRRWSDMGYLHGYRTPGGQRRFPVQELDEFVSSLEERGGAGGARFVRSDDAANADAEG